MGDPFILLVIALLLLIISTFLPEATVAIILRIVALLLALWAFVVM